MLKHLTSARRISGEVLRGRWTILYLRLFLGSAFLISGIAKIVDHAAFGDPTASGAALPHALAQFYGSALPWVEVVLGSLLVLGLLSRWASVTGIALIASFVAADSYDALNGAGSSGGCYASFGRILPLTGTGAIVVDFAMLMTALPLAFSGSRFISVYHCLSQVRLDWLKHLAFPNRQLARLAMVVLVLAIVAPTCLVPPALVSGEPSLNSQIDAALRSGQPVFLYVYADWCRFCQERKPTIDEMEQQYDGRIAFIRVNGDENADAVQQFNVTGYPTMLLITDKDSGGEYQYRSFQGYSDKQAFEVSFDSFLEHGFVPDVPQNIEGQRVPGETIGAGSCQDSPESCGPGETSLSGSCDTCGTATATGNSAVVPTGTALDADINNALASGKAAFVFFYADWCHFCQQQKPIVDELEQTYGKSIAFIRVNGPESPEAASEFGVTGFPTMFLITGKNEQGYVEQEFAGLTEGDVLRGSLEYLIENGRLPESVNDSMTGLALETANVLATASTDACCPLSVTYTNMRSIGCGALGLCGAKLIYQVANVGTCGGDNCQGKWLTERVTADHGCRPDTPDTGSGCPIGAGNNLGCIDSYQLCYGPWEYPAGGCVETLTQTLFVDGVPVERCNITFTITNENWLTCSGTVTRSCTRLIDPAICTECNKHDGWYCSIGKREYRDYYCDRGRCAYDVTQTEDCGVDRICEQTTGGATCVPRVDCDDRDPCTLDYYENGSCKHRPMAGCDHPDDSYDVSTPEAEQTHLSDTSSAPSVAILRAGDAYSTQKLLKALGETTAFADVNFSPALASDYPILIISSGGLYGLDSSLTFRSNLEQYVEHGGTLVVFAQQHGYEYGALPSEQVSGFGWLEDQSCQHGSVGISTYHPILSGQDSPALDIGVDGFFTDYPDDATVLLTRTKNGMPAMLTYPYGEGRVVVTTAYEDWAYGHGQATQDGKNLVRDMIAWARSAQSLPDYGVGQALNIPVDVPSVYLPVAGVDYPQYTPGDLITIPIEITNGGDETADKVVFFLFDPEHQMERVEMPVSIAQNETSTVNLPYQTTAYSEIGVYHILYSLYSGETLQGGGLAGGFALGLDPANLTTYKINFTLHDPNMNVVENRTVTVTVPPGGNETADFTYDSPSQLGIWSLRYEIRDYQDILLESGTKVFAVSNFAANPGGFAYRGPQLSISATTPEDHVAKGSEVVFSVMVNNNGDTDFTGNIAVGGHEARQEGGRWWAYYGAITDISVPAHSQQTFTYSRVMNLSTAMYFGLYQAGVKYDNLAYQFHYGACAISEKGVWVFQPSVAVGVATDRPTYTAQESIQIALDLANSRNAPYDVSTTVRVLDPGNRRIFENTVDLTLTAGASNSRSFSVPLPADAAYGIYLVTAEAYVGGQKVGSNSTYFEVRKGYIVRVVFDRVNKAYNARETMNLDLEAVNDSPFPWDTIIDISVPRLGIVDSVALALDPGQSETMRYSPVIPNDILAGQYAVTVTVRSDGSSQQYSFFVPESRLVLETIGTSFDAGGSLRLNLTNAGGVDTSGDLLVRVYDSRGVLIHHGRVSESILAGQCKALDFPISSQAVAGDYYLQASCTDLGTSRVTTLSKAVTVHGLQADLISATSKKAYFNDEDISILTTITNLDGEIIGGWLNLKVIQAVNGEGWIKNEANGHYYRLTDPAGWSQAEAQAVDWGGHLATVNNREEELWARTQFGAREHFWIGFNDVAAEGIWVWVNGEPITYTNWASEEPNNYRGVEDAAVMNWAPGEGQYGDSWNDLPPTGQLRGIVEVSADLAVNSTSLSSLSVSSADDLVLESIAATEDTSDSQPNSSWTGVTPSMTSWATDYGTMNSTGGGCIGPFCQPFAQPYLNPYADPAVGTEPSQDLTTDALLSEDFTRWNAVIWQSLHSLPTSNARTGGSLNADPDALAVQGTGSVAGFVYEADNVTPIEGATVRVSAYDAPVLRFDGETTTNASGAYTLSGLDSGDYRVWASAEGRAYELYRDTSIWGEEQPVSVAEGLETANVNFTLEPGGTISGNITSSGSGEPLSNVSVIVYMYDSEVGNLAFSDSDGNYMATGLPYGTYVALSPSPWRYGGGDDGYMTEYWQEDNGEEPDGITVSVSSNPVDINFTLEVGGSISGVVTDEAGNPIAGADVYGYSDTASSSAQTAEDGTYRIEGLPSGSYRVQAHASIYVAEYYNNVRDWNSASLVSVTVPDDTPNISFALEVGGSVSGVVKDEAGNPITEAYVYALGQVASGGSQTKADGTYVITGLLSGNYRVQAQATGYAREYYNDVYDLTSATLVTVTQPNETTDIVFTLGPGGSISGAVSDDTGSPVAGAWVYAWNWTSGEWKGSGQTAADGTYAIRDLPSGTYRLRAQATGLLTEYYANVYDSSSATPVAVIAPNNTPNVDFSLGIGGSISGVVANEQGQPIPGARVNAKDANSGRWMQATSTATDGSYTITGLPPGDYWVRAMPSESGLAGPQYVDEFYDNVYAQNKARSIKVTAPNNVPNINFALAVGGTIRGHIYQTDGITPISGVYLYAEDYDTRAWIEDTNSKQDGSYALVLPTGGYRVWACPSCNGRPYVNEYYDGAYDWTAATEILVTVPNDTSNIDFTLGIGGSISGVVANEAGDAVGGAVVYAWDYSTGEQKGTSTTAANGSYVIRLLQPGSYRVGAKAFGYGAELYDNVHDTSLATPVPASESSTTPNINFSLEVGGSISGVVTDEAGNPIENAHVYAWAYSSHVQMGSVSTLGDGSYTIPDLASGSYIVQARMPGYVFEYYAHGYNQDQAMAISVTQPGDTPGIDFRLEIAGTVSGHVYLTDGATPVANLHVYAQDYDSGLWTGGTNTKADGSYSIALPNGRYLVGTCPSCSGLDYISEWYDETYYNTRGIAVAVASPGDTPGIDFTLETGGTISGHVYQADGLTPMPGVSVGAVTSDTWVWMGGVRTRLDGSYTLMLPAGTYFVNACPTCSGLSYVNEWYDNTLDSGKAVPVSVSVPGNTAGIDFTLEIGGIISGHVFQADGMTPIPNIDVSAQESGTGIWMSSVRTKGDGSYALSVPVGNYRVRTNSASSGFNYVEEWYKDKPDWSQATPVSVTAPGGVSGIDFMLEMGGTISGHVYQADGVSPIAGVNVYAEVYTSGLIVTGVLSKADGSYSLVVPTGQYRVTANGSSYGLNYVQEWYDNKSDSSHATPVSVTAPADTSGINFALETGGIISGHVYQEDGLTPIADVDVSAQDYRSGATVVSDRTNQDGQYTLVGLTSGTYRVYARPSQPDPKYVSEYYEGTYYSPEATPITLTVPNETSGIDFTLDLGGTVSGHVYQADGVTPIGGVHVYAVTYNTSVWMQGTNTGLDGNYTLVLPAGTYRIQACPSCSGLTYVNKWYDDTFDSNQATLVSVTLPGDTPGIDFALGTGGTISGHVYETDGVTPVANVDVSPQDSSTGVWMNGVRTRVDGSYSLVVPTGTYRLRACPSCSGLNYVEEWYDETADSIHATPVSVTAPDDTSGIDFTLEAGGTISGHVYQEDGVTPIANVDVYAQGYGGGATTASARTDQDGQYALVGLHSGTYWVNARPPRPGSSYVSEYFGGTYDRSKSTPMSIDGTVNISGVDFVLEPGAVLSGHVYQEDGMTPIPNVQVYACDYDTWAWMDGMNTAQDGSYSLVVPTGDYRLRAAGFSSGLNYVSQWYDHTHNANQATRLSVNAQDYIPGVDFALELGGKVSGHVYQEDGVTPIPSVHVYVQDRDTNVWMEGTNTSPDGTYFMVLPTGTYQVSACPSCSGLNYLGLRYVREWYDGTYYEPQAAAVEVTALEDTPGIDFTLDIGGTISGHVYQGDGVTPVRGVHVYAEDYATGLWMEGINTNFDGSYSLLVPTGTYRVRVCASCSGLNYLDAWYDGAYDRNQATAVYVTAPNDTLGINFLLRSPTLTVSPLSGPVGTPVTVSGSNLTPGSTIPVGGLTFAGLPWNGTALAINSLGGFTCTTLKVPSAGIGPQKVVATDSNGVRAQATFIVGAIVWEKTIPVGVGALEVKDVLTSINIPSEMPGVTGKLYLVATLYSSSSQTIAQSERFSFFITDQDVSLTLETDKDVYRPNETISIHGDVRNDAPIADQFSLSIGKDSQEILSESFVLAPGESYSFATTTTSETSFTLTGAVDGMTVTGLVRIEYPSVDVTIAAPDIVGLEAFDVGVLVENTGSVEADIGVSAPGETWDILIPIGESRLLETSTSITQDTTFRVVVTGDVEKTVEKQIVMGERARIEISPAVTYLEGPVELPFTVVNTGVMDAEFGATFSMSPGGQTITRTLFVPEGQANSDTLNFDLARGVYTLTYESNFETGSLQENVGAPDFVLTQLPSNLSLVAGQDATWVFKIKNIGGAEGEAHLRLTAPDFQDTRSAWVMPGEEQEIFFDFRVPDDLEEKEYKAACELNGIPEEFSFFIQGLKIAVTGSLDKSLYVEGETAILTLEVANESIFDLSLYARVKLHEYDEVQPFEVLQPGDSQTLAFYVPVTFNGNKLFYGIYTESGRALYLNALYVLEKQTVALFTDKQVYVSGETATVFVETSGPGTLNISAPGYTAELGVDGKASLTFSVPELRSGTYYIEYSFEGFTSSYPFDVVGYSARILEFSLNKGGYVSGDTVSMMGDVEVNRAFSGLFRVSMYDPEQALIGELAMPQSFFPGENDIEISTILSTYLRGIHVAVYQVYADLAGQSMVLLASGAEYFDAAPPGATIDAITPNEGHIGQTLDVVITGSLLTGTTASDVSLGVGIAVNNVTVDSDSQITVNITIGNSAGLGPRDVVVNTPNGTVALPSGFEVKLPRWDINQDCRVDYLDLAILGARYGETTSPPYPAWDINQDGKIDYKDLAILGAHYGEVC